MDVGLGVTVAAVHAEVISRWLLRLVGGRWAFLVRGTKAATGVRQFAGQGRVESTWGKHEAGLMFTGLHCKGANAYPGWKDPSS